MKRRIFAAAFLWGLLLTAVSPDYSHAAQPESRLYGELRSTMQTGAYPQTVVLADQLLKTYPLTLYKESILLMKGESLCRLGRYDECLATLQPFAGKSPEAAYWCGRSWFAEESYTSAANYFQAAVTLLQARPSPDPVLLQSSLVYSAQSMAELDDSFTAIQLLEYAFDRCPVTAELQRGLVLLFTLYSRHEEHEKILQLYDRTRDVVEQFPAPVRDSIKVAVVKACGASGSREDVQWNMCLLLLESSNEETVISALSHAYMLAEESDVYDVSVLLDKAEPFLQGQPRYRSELWLRLGRKSCLAGQCDKAFEYYERAMKTADADQMGYLTLYMADCWLERGNVAKARETLKSGLFLETPLALQITITLVQQYLNDGNTADAFTCSDRLWQLYTACPDHPLAMTALYYHAWMYARRDDWKTVRTELEPFFAAGTGDNKDEPSAEMKILYGQSLMKTRSVSDTDVMQQVERLFREASAALDDTENRTAARQNLAVLHLLQTRYTSAYTVARPESSLGYIAGLGAVGSGDWNSAASLLGVDSPWGLYYTAYARYQSGNTGESQTLFTRFCRDYGDHVMIRSAWQYVTLSAIQNDDRKTALQAAEKWYRYSVNDAQKIESALLWAELYAADHQFDKAIALLKPLAAPRTKAAVTVRFSLADLYSAKGDMAAAAQLLLDTQSAYFDETVKEEALYRLAELYFRQGRFAEAAIRFESCRKTYPSGSHAQQALYYNALCLDRVGDRQSKESAVLLYTMVTQGSRNSPYLFASWARLAVLNRELGAYALSLEAIEQAVRLSPKEAGALGLGDLKKQVLLLQNGEEEQVVQLVSDYESYGGARTEKGRSVGVQLSRHYLASVSTRQQGIETLRAVTDAVSPSATSVTDRKSAAEAWALTGTWQRQELLLADSVDSFITSASFWAGINTDRQEEALYNAIKSLYELGRMADSRNVLNKMKEIDSSSSWVSPAEALLDDYLEY